MKQDLSKILGEAGTLSGFVGAGVDPALAFVGLGVAVTLGTGYAIYRYWKNMQESGLRRIY